MKQTVEEAAKECRRTTAQSMGVYAQYHSIDECPNHGITYDEIAEAAFIKGAEWQAKQSPWISVKEQLPEPNKEVLLYDKNSIRHYVIGWLRRDKGYNKGMWALSNGWIEDKDITHWMPIDKPITE